MLNRLTDVIRLLLTTNDTIRQIARTMQSSPASVGRYAKLLQKTDRDWADDLDALPAPELWQLFNRPRRVSNKVIPDFEAIREGLKEDGMTLLFLHDEYVKVHGAAAFSYPRYTQLWKAHRKSRKAELHNEYLPGHVLMADFSGKESFHLDRATGARVPVKLFVGILGFSQYLFVRAVYNEGTFDWLDCNDRALEFYGGKPECIVFDNLKSAVQRAAVRKKSEMTVHQADYLEWGRHHGIALFATRPACPSDKGMVEGAVRIIQRMLPHLARLRVFSLDELNAEILKWLEVRNARAFQQANGVRSELFRDIEQPKLRPLPETPYVFRKWVAKKTVGIDYHLRVERHYYSVPHTYIGQRVEPRMSAKEVEFHCNGERIAVHPRSSRADGFSTVFEHQPEAHRAMRGRTPDGMRTWSRTEVGPRAAELVEGYFQGKVPLQGLERAIAVRNLLGKCANPAQLEAACDMALSCGKTMPSDIRTFLDVIRAKEARRPDVLRRAPPSPSLPAPPRRASMTPQRSAYQVPTGGTALDPS